MRQIQPDLWETRTESPFPGLTTHAYLLIRSGGNILFYNTSHIDELDHMATLGGVAYQFLSHRDELGPSLNVICTRFDAQLGGHIAERDDFSRIRAPDILFDAQEEILDGLTVIPLPGHSPGSVAFDVVSSTGQRYLFTGDTLYRAQGNVWKAGFIPGHNTAEDAVLMTHSLKRLYTLEPDLVIGSAFGAKEGYEEMTPSQWRRRLDRSLEELQTIVDSEPR